MSAGLWARMRDALITAGQAHEDLTARELATRIGAVDELTTVVNILYTVRKSGAHVERVDPDPTVARGAYRWRLLRDARVQRPQPDHRRSASHDASLPR